MTALLTIEGKVFGQKRPLFSNFAIPFPPEWEGGERLTLRAVISRIVQEEVKAFEGRQEQRRMVQTLTQADIERGIMRGKVDPGGRDAAQKVEVEAAIGNALLAFEDGLYFIFIDDEQQTDLDREVYLKSDSKITFLRLVALAGG